MRKILILLLLSSCHVGISDTKYEVVRDTVTVFCDKVQDCGNAPGGRECVIYNMENICPGDDCFWELSEEQVSDAELCLEQLSEMQCSSPLMPPAICGEVLLWENGNDY